MNTAILVFFIGSYTQMLSPDYGGSGEGIYSMALNTETGEISILHKTYTINPSYLVLSDDNKFLYSVTEVTADEDPKVRAYKINNDFSLKLLNEQPIIGGYPCHIEYSNNNLMVSCYGTGNILQYPIDNSGSVLKYNVNYQHSGSSVNPQRQEGPHAHQAAVHPNGKDVFVSDLGIDKLKAYELIDNKLIKKEDKDVSVTLGSGPRHMVFNKEGSLCYVINELSGEVFVLGNKEEKFEVIASYNSLPATYKENPSSSAIRIHPNGKYLYAANRGFEAITIFGINKKELELIDYQSTNGKTLREFNITPDGKWLIACHQDSNDIVVFKIESNGKLKEHYRTKNVTSPVCVAFIKVK